MMVADFTIICIRQKNRYRSKPTNIMSISAVLITELRVSVKCGSTGGV